MGAISREDLKAIFSLAQQVAEVDDNVAVFEKEILNRFAEVAGLSGAERATLEQQPAGGGEGLERLSGDEAKRFLVKTLCAVAYSDGVRHDSEIAFIRTVNERLGNVIELLPWDEWETYVLEVVDTLDDTGR